MTDSADDHLPCLDLVGLRCPLPALRVRKHLRTMRPGERLAVRATDPLAGIDIPHAAREGGAVVESQRCEAGGGEVGGSETHGRGAAGRDGPVWHFTIRAGASGP